MFDELNKRLISAKKQFLYPGMLLLITGFIGTFLFMEVVGPVLILNIIIGFVLLIVYSSKASAVSKEFKQVFVAALIESEFDHVRYSIEGKLSKQAFYKYEFGLSGNIYKTNDHIEASYKGIQFSLCDVLLQQRTRSGKTTHTVTRFQGPVLSIRLNKSQPGKLQVLESSRLTWFDDYDKVEMESIAFNKTFNVYSTNEILAFYILTPHFMEKLMKVERENPGKLYFTFINGYLNIGLYNRKDNFEIAGKTISDETLLLFKSQIRKIKEIIEEVVKIEEGN